MRISKAHVVAGTACCLLSGVGLAAQSSTAPSTTIHRAVGDVPPGATRAVVADCGPWPLGGGRYATVRSTAKSWCPRPESVTLKGRHASRPSLGVWWSTTRRAPWSSTACARPRNDEAGVRADGRPLPVVDLSGRQRIRCVGLDLSDARGRLSRLGARVTTCRGQGGSGAMSGGKRQSFPRRWTSEHRVVLDAGCAERRGCPGHRGLLGKRDSERTRAGCPHQSPDRVPANRSRAAKRRLAPRGAEAIQL